MSTLTPSQLARKRANDREAQRAIRARTKEHIERLERELEELKSQRSGDEKYQELLRTNKALQKEIRTLRESMGLPHNSQYPPVGEFHSTPPPPPLLGALLESRREKIAADSVSCEENLSMPNSEVPSRASSYGHSAPTDYKQPQEYGAPYLSTPEPSDSWAGTIPVSVPASNGSSPSSSGPIEEYNGYIPTSVAPAPAMMEAVGMPPANVPYSQEAKYEEVDGHGMDSRCVTTQERCGKLTRYHR